MNRIILLSPAKLNLFLKVQNKRPDGYHNIVTVFERINLADKISFRPTSGRGIKIVCDHKHVPVGKKNLIHKAAQLLREDFDIPDGAEITISKKIPVAAGLAGGSSNAATALMGLNQLWNLRLSRSQLLSYAKNIGSDVPFFLHDASWALGTERGDRIKKLEIKTKIWHILVVPHVKMYSWKVYRSLKISPVKAKTALKGRQNSAWGASQSEREGRTNILTKIHDNANILIRNLKKDNILDVGAFLANDLENEVFRLYPPLKKLKERLKSLNTQGVMVSGSGPSVFGITSTEDEAKAVKKELSKRFSQVFVVQTL